MAVLLALIARLVSMGEVYGEFNDITQERTGGLGSKAMQGVVVEKSLDHTWSVLDGPGDAIWIGNTTTMVDDNMTFSLVNRDHTWSVLDGSVGSTCFESINTVFNDSTTLSLANRESVKQNWTSRKFFEVTRIGNLALTLPATVSRCGMVYLTDTDPDWQPYVRNSTIEKLDLDTRYVDGSVQWVLRYATDTCFVIDLDMYWNSNKTRTCRAVSLQSVICAGSPNGVFLTNVAHEYIPPVIATNVASTSTGSALGTSIRDVFWEDIDHRPIFLGGTVIWTPQANTTRTTQYAVYISPDNAGARATQLHHGPAVSLWIRVGTNCLEVYPTLLYNLKHEPCSWLSIGANTTTVARRMSDSVTLQLYDFSGRRPPSTAEICSSLWPSYICTNSIDILHMNIGGRGHFLLYSANAHGTAHVPVAYMYKQPPGDSEEADDPNVHSFFVSNYFHCAVAGLLMCLFALSSLIIRLRLMYRPTSKLMRSRKEYNIAALCGDAAGDDMDHPPVVRFVPRRGKQAIIQIDGIVFECR